VPLTARQARKNVWWSAGANVSSVRSPLGQRSLPVTAPLLVARTTAAPVAMLCST